MAGLHEHRGNYIQLAMDLTIVLTVENISSSRIVNHMASRETLSFLASQVDANHKLEYAQIF